MPLTWDLTDITDYKQVCWITEDEGMGEEKKRLDPVTHSLVMATMSISMGEITAKNADEFYARISIIDRLFGGFLIEDGKPAYLTPEHIRAHVGLRTNVSEETRAKWLKRVIGGEMDAAARRYRKYVEDLKAGISAAFKQLEKNEAASEKLDEQELQEAQTRAEQDQAALAAIAEAPETKPNPFMEKE